MSVYNLIGTILLGAHFVNPQYNNHYIAKARLSVGLNLFLHHPVNILQVMEHTVNNRRITT